MQLRFFVRILLRPSVEPGGAEVAHIEKRGECRYRLRYRDPEGKERSKTFALRRDARRFQSVVEEELARGMWVDPRASRKRFGVFAAAATEPRSNVRPATSARIASYLRVQIMPTFTDVPLRKISRLSVQAWVDAMTQTLAPRTVRDSYRVLAGFMREAERQGLIRQSPCYLIVLPRMPRPEPRFLAPDQVARLAAAIDVRYEPLIYSGAYLGLRWSELAGLKRERISICPRGVSASSEPLKGSAAAGAIASS